MTNIYLATAYVHLTNKVNIMGDFSQTQKPGKARNSAAQTDRHYSLLTPENSPERVHVIIPHTHRCSANVCVVAFYVHVLRCLVTNVHRFLVEPVVLSATKRSILFKVLHAVQNSSCFHELILPKYNILIIGSSSLMRCGHIFLCNTFKNLPSISYAK